MTTRNSSDARREINYFRTLVSFIAALMLVAACGQDTAEPISPAPDTTVPDTHRPGSATSDRHFQPATIQLPTVQLGKSTIPAGEQQKSPAQ